MGSMAPARVGRLAACVALLVGGLTVPYAAAQPSVDRRCRPVPTKVQLLAPQVTAGGSVDGTVTVSCSRSRKTVVALSAFPGASVPTTVTVPAGKRRAFFTVATAASSPAFSGQVSAVRRGVATSAPLAVVRQPVVTGNPPPPPPPQPPPGCEPEVTDISAPDRVHAQERFVVEITLSCRRGSGQFVDLDTSSNLDVEGSTYIWVPAGVNPVAVQVETLGDGAGGQPGWVSARVHGGSSTPVVASTIVGPGLFSADVPRGPLYWDEPRFMTLTLTGVAPPTGQVVDVASSDTDVIPATRVRVPAGTRAVRFRLTVREPSRSRDVELRASLGRLGVTVETEVNWRPPIGGQVTMSFLYSDPVQPLNSRDEHVPLRVFLDHPAGFEGLSVELSSDQPEVFPATRVRVLPDEYERTAYVNLGAVPETTLITVTGTVEGHPDVTGTFAFTVHPGVASIEAPDVVVPGQVFTVTAHMMGPADIDQEFWFHPNYAECEPPDRQLLAGATVMQATCTVLDHRPGLYSMSIWLDGDFNLGLPVRVVAR